MVCMTKTSRSCRIQAHLPVSELTNVWTLNSSTPKLSLNSATIPIFSTSPEYRCRQSDAEEKIDQNVQM